MDKVKAIQSAVDSAEVREPRFKMVAFDDIALSPVKNYVVKGLIPREGLTIIWGPPKCGKSFWCFDLMLHVALGWEYRDRRIMQGPVVYVALEGGAAMGARAEAFRRAKMANETDRTPFYLIIDRLDLSNECDILKNRISEQLDKKFPIAVVIDTLNRSLAGSESRDVDMTAYIQAADALREAFKCAVAIVHHCGIDTTRPRGHTSLAGAVDAQLAVKRDNRTGFFTVTVERMKDGPEGDILANELLVTDAGIDVDGDTITSCVVVQAEAPTSSASRLNARQRRAIEVLHNVMVDHSQPSPGGRHYPPGVRLVAINLWKEHLFSAGVIDKDGKNPRQDFRRIKEQLNTKDAIREWDDLVWAVKDND